MSEKTGYGPLAAPQRRHPPSSPISIVLRAILGIFALGALYIWYGGSAAVYPTSPHLTGARKVLKENPLIDGHNDLLILIRAIYGNHIYYDNFTTPLETGGMPGQFDFPRAKSGQLGGSFWSAFMPCPADGFDFSDEAYAPYVKATLEQIDLFNRLSEKYPEQFTLPRKAQEAEANWKAGKLISPLIIEGLHQIGNSLSTLRLYHTLGVRYATLCWNCHNKYADAALVSIDGETVASKPYHGGVSKAGQELILEMNRLGMMVDLSHVSVDTMRDVLGGSSTAKGWKGSIAPPIFSHSSAKAVCPHPRNVPDDILQLVKKREGVVMVNFAPEFVSCKDPDPRTGLPDFVNKTSTIEQVAKHIMHIGQLIGYDYVGLGSDFDGIATTPRGLEDVSKYPDLIQLLLDNGVSEKDAGKVAGRNILRVWHEVDRVAEKLQKEMNPVEDDLSAWINGEKVEVL